MDESKEEAKRSKRPLQESDIANADGMSLAKKRKEHKESVKTQKAAAIATANEMAKQIFHERNTIDAISYSETQRQQHLDEIKKLRDKVKELGEKLDDKQSAIEAKRVVVSHLEEKVEQLEEEKLLLKSEVASSKCSTHSSTGKYYYDRDKLLSYF